MNAADVLEAIGLPKRLPDLRYLRDLFDAFNRVVPFETASKIVRNADVASPAEKPRLPDVFWAEHVDFGTGGTCFARVAAFAALTEAVGFRPAKILGGITGPRNHASLLYALDGRTWLADPGYPLPDLIPLETAAFETGVGSLEFEASARSAALRFVSGPEYGRVIDFSLDPASEDEFRGAWEKTFSKSSLFLKEVVLRKPDGHRILRFFRGSVDLTDAHSRARIPLASDRAGKLSGIFGVDAPLLARAFAITGDAGPDRATARIEAYGEAAGAEAAFKALSTPEGYRRFLAGLGETEVERRDGDRWRATVRAENGETIVEDVERVPGEDLIRVRRSGGLADTGFALDRSGAAPRLVRFADLPDAREEFLRNDMGRGRIAGILAMDLLAAARLQPAVIASEAKRSPDDLEIPRSLESPRSGDRRARD